MQQPKDPLKNPLIIGLFIFAVLLILLFGAIFAIIQYLSSKGG